MLGVLPPEIILSIFAFVPLRQLQRFFLVSKSWHTFIHQNESSLFHAAAVLHDFIPTDLYLRDAEVSDVPWIGHIDTWKDLCIEFYRMERRWEGNGCARMTAVDVPGERVWRFKVDEEQRTVITTHSHGGLVVFAIDEKAALWSLPYSTVHAFAHCEFSDGFLVFTREGETLEVWRRTRDVRTSSRPLTAEPDAIQRRAQELAWQSELSTTQNERGAFTPWAAISPPNPVRALRLVHSTLLVASESAREAYLYDVSTGRLTQTVSFRGPHYLPFRVNYVELGPRHIFVCTIHDVLVYPLDANDSQTLLKFPSHEEGFDDFYRTQAIRVDYDVNLPIYSNTFSRSTLVECVLDPAQLTAYPPSQRDFQAVHVSPCGSHFATVDDEGFLCIVRNFEKALRDGVSLLGDISIFDMRYPILNLAFEEKRVAVYVHQRGIFVIPFVSEDNVSVDTFTMEPQRNSRVLHLNVLGMRDSMRSCSCLQLTRFGLWFSWTQRTYANPHPETVDNKLNFIDFSDFSVRTFGMKTCDTDGCTSTERHQSSSLRQSTTKLGM